MHSNQKFMGSVISLAVCRNEERQINKDRIYHQASDDCIYCANELLSKICHAKDIEIEKLQNLCLQLSNALKQIKSHNKNDGNSPDDSMGPDSMPYWRWQELISRQIANDTLVQFEIEIEKIRALKKGSQNE